MQHPLTQGVALLFTRLRNPSSVPARIRQAVARTVASVAMVPLLLSVTEFVGFAHAQSVVTTSPRGASTGDPFANFVVEAAQRFGVPAPWISAVMAMESGGNMLALSPQGAMGLMQIMPDTWADLRDRYGLGADPYEPRDNILAGAAYLREMHDRYGSPGFLAAYNAGPTRYEEHLATGRELPAETQLYVTLLAPRIGEGQTNGMVTISRRVVPWQDSPLFAALVQSSSAVMPSSFHLPSDRSLAGRPVVGASALAPQADGLFIRRGSARRVP